MLMPIEIEQFARYCLISQEMLVPRLPLHPNSDKKNTTFGQPIKDTDHATACWSHHYNKYKDDNSTSFIDASFAITTLLEIQIPKKIGPTSIDNIPTKEHYYKYVKIKSLSRISFSFCLIYLNIVCMVSRRVRIGIGLEDEPESF
jgi:hypothetical protein